MTKRDKAAVSAASGTTTITSTAGYLVVVGVSPSTATGPVGILYIALVLIVMGGAAWLRNQ